MTVDRYTNKDALGAVRELVAKWRHQEPTCSALASQNRKDAFRRCANELEAALAQAPASGEAVAPFGYCADFETGLYECSHKFYYLAPGQPVPEGCTPFYTTPPAPVPAVRVTDEMVRRASDACCVVIDTRTGGKAWFAPETDDDIRRMLEAALGQENGS